MKNDRDTLLYMAYTIWGILGLCIIGFLCMFNKIRLAIAIIKTATIFVGDVPLVMLVPPIFTIFTAIFWTFWIFGAVYLYAIGTITKSADTPLASVELDDTAKKNVVVLLIRWLMV